MESARAPPVEIRCCDASMAQDLLDRKNTFQISILNTIPNNIPFMPLFIKTVERCLSYDGSIADTWVKKIINDLNIMRFESFWYIRFCFVWKYSNIYYIQSKCCTYMLTDSHALIIQLDITEMLITVLLLLFAQYLSAMSIDCLSFWPFSPRSIVFYSINLVWSNVMPVNNTADSIFFCYKCLILAHVMRNKLHFSQNGKICRKKWKHCQVFHEETSQCILTN